MHLVELIDLLDQIITMELHVAFWSAWPPLVEEDKTQGAPGAAGLSGDTVVDPERAQRPDQNRTTDGKIVEPGKFYSVPAGRTWRYLVLPAESTAHLERLYTKATALIDLIGIPSVMRGQGGGGQAGYAIAQLMIAARSLYGPVVENFCAQVATQTQYLWWQVWKRFPEGVPVYYQGDAARGRKKGWRTLTPKDIAPDGKGAGQGTPFLACAVEADPLLPGRRGPARDAGHAGPAGGRRRHADHAGALLQRPGAGAHRGPGARRQDQHASTRPGVHGPARGGPAGGPDAGDGFVLARIAVQGDDARWRSTNCSPSAPSTRRRRRRLLVQMEQAKLQGQQGPAPGMPPGGMPTPGVPPPAGMPGMPGPHGRPQRPAHGAPTRRGADARAALPMPPGAPGNALPMQGAGRSPARPAPPGVPALPGMPMVAQMPGAAPPMGPPQRAAGR